MGLLNAVDSFSRNKARTKSDASGQMGMQPEKGAAGGGGGQGGEGNPDDTSTLDKEEGNVLTTIIAQLRPGMDLSKIALPTFVLEPRSLLERITDFFSHPELIMGVGDEPDPKQRFIAVMTYYLSGWHIKPKGVKKPYNPVLGEFFRCSYHDPDGSEAFYVAEQVSHHPPVSAFFYISPKGGVLVSGELKPKSRFLGNSAATIMEGEDRIRLLNRPEDGDYVITMPNTYARGILFGKMTLELCDPSSITCAATNHHCDVDFKAKGWISGGYNAIHGQVKGAGNKEVGEVSGHWSDVIEYGDKKAGNKRVLFDPHTAAVVPKSVLPEAEQEEYESQRLWAGLTKAIKATDMHGATDAKAKVEDRQRQVTKLREDAGKLPEVRFFKHTPGDKWLPKIDIDNLPKDRTQMESQIRQWIFGDRAPSADNASKRGSVSAPSKGAPNTGRGSVSAASTERGSVSAGSTGQFSTQKSAGKAPISASSTPPPPVNPTAPGPPAPGPKYDHPVPSRTA